MTTVPYLARRVVSGVRWQEFARFEVHPCRKLFTFWLRLLIGVAALNTGNNLLYLIVSTMLGAVLGFGGLFQSGAARSGAARGSAASRSSQRNTRSAVWIPNTRRWVAFALRFARSSKGTERQKGDGDRSGTFGFPPRRPPERQWLHVRDLKIPSRSRRTARAFRVSGNVHLL